MTYRDQVQRRVLQVLDDATRDDPDTFVSYDELVTATGLPLNDIDDAVSALDSEHKVRLELEGSGGGLVQIAAAGQDALADSAVPDPRVDLRNRVLYWLYERARHDRYAYSHVAEIAADLHVDDRLIFAAARYLDQKGWASYYRTSGALGETMVQITVQGQAAVDHPDRSSPAPQAVTQHVTFNAPVGQSIVGGQGHRQSAHAISFAPADQQTQDIVRAIAALRALVRDDPSVDVYSKDDDAQALTTLEGEVVKPVSDQDHGRIAHILRKFLPYGPAVIAALSQLEALINNRPRI